MKSRVVWDSSGIMASVIPGRKINKGFPTSNGSVCWSSMSQTILLPSPLPPSQKKLTQARQANTHMSMLEETFFLYGGVAEWLSYFPSFLLKTQTHLCSKLCFCSFSGLLHWWLTGHGQCIYLQSNGKVCHSPQGKEGKLEIKSPGPFVANFLFLPAKWSCYFQSTDTENKKCT